MKVVLLGATVCGLTYSGIMMKAPQRDHYYRCNATHLLSLQELTESE
jgi:hypothetical protein